MKKQLIEILKGKCLTDAACERAVKEVVELFSSNQPPSYLMEENKKLEPSGLIVGTMPSATTPKQQFQVKTASPELAVVFTTTDEEVLIKFTPNGEIFIKGEKTKDSMKIGKAFKEFVKSQIKN